MLKRLRFFLQSKSLFTLFYLVFITIVSCNLFYFNVSLFAQIQPKFNHLSISQGLSQSTANCILHDNNGFIWIGTQDGLNCFDGYSFTIFRHNPKDSNSLPDNYIQALAEDKFGNIWIGSWNKGLVKYQPAIKRFTRFANSSIFADCPNSNSIMCLLPLTSGEIALGTMGGGVILFNPATNQIKKYTNVKNEKSNSLSSNNIKCLFQKDNLLFVGTTDAGINIIDLATEKIKQYKINADENKNKLEVDNIQTINQLANGEIIVGTFGGGIFSFHSNSTPNFIKISPENATTNSLDKKITSIIPVDTNNLWIGTFGDGLFHLNLKTKNVLNYKHNIFLPYTLSNNTITHLYYDTDSILWICTLGGGVHYFEPNKTGFNHVKFPYEKDQKGDINTVMAINMDNSGSLWIGTYGNGAIKYNQSTNIAENIFFNKHTTNVSTSIIVRSIAHDAKHDILWLGTNKGLFSYNIKTKLLSQVLYEQEQGKPVNLDIWSVFLDKNDNIWLGAWNQGLKFIKKGTSSIKNIDITDKLEKSFRHIIAISSKNDYMYCGNFKGGVWQIKIKDENFEFTSINELSQYNVRCIYVENDSILWLGTDGSGLIRYNSITKQILQIDQFAGLSNDVVYGILDDDNGNIWVSTNNGICSYHKSSGRIRTFSVHDGLQSNEFNQGSAYKSSNGTMYFGGINGLTYFNPWQIKENKKTQKVVLTSVKLFGKEIETDTSFFYRKHYYFDYWQNFLSFEFAALSYISPQQTQYACKMLGFDNDWIQLGQKRFVSYTNLDPGKYTFLVKAANSDGYWGEDMVSIQITIYPPFWKTTWFYILCIVIALLSVYGYTAYRTRKLIKDKQVLEQIVSQRTAEVIKQKNEIIEINKELLLQRDEIAQQRDEIETKNRNITDSIRYAQKIQNAILTPDEIIESLFPESFIIYLPKDIVSGDFYWVEELKDMILIAAVDCTGHGVPGALMSVIAAAGLNQAVNEHQLTKPAEILDFLNVYVAKVLRLTNDPSSVKDGMDISLISIHKTSKKMNYAGAYQPIYIIRHKELVEFKPDRFPIGMHSVEKNKAFENHEFQLQANDLIYMFSDGYVDQFSESTGKKFLSKNLKKLLLELSELNMPDQKMQLVLKHQEWKGNVPQVDDILLMGFKIV